uniref:Uncharacterized protein n=1 Tax=Laticauda laticaudata TaxID=8630 RepID=A0A8C5RDG2_LATLA
MEITAYYSEDYSTCDESAKSTEMEITEGDLEDPSMSQAAVKIQAAFKGYKVRKEIKQQERPVFVDTFKDFVGKIGDTLHLDCVAHKSPCNHK